MIYLLSMSTNAYLPSIWIRLEAGGVLWRIMKQAHDSSRFSSLNFKIVIIDVAPKKLKYLIIKEVFGKIKS